MTLKHVEANGIRFAYLEEGSGPLVLMMHGFPDTPHTWDVARPAVAKAGYRVVTPFTRGYAPTSQPADGDYGRAALGADVIALIEALGEERAIVVGHDWGASAAYDAAFTKPERVSLLVTLAIPHPASLPRSPLVLWKVRHFFALKRDGAAKRMRETDFAYVDELVRRWSPGWNVPPGETDAVKASFREPGSVEAAVAYYRALSFTAKPPGRIRVPTVSFAGLTDIVAPHLYARAARWFSAGYGVIEMPGGHFMHREHPERFAGELVKAITSRA